MPRMPSRRCRMPVLLLLLAGCNAAAPPADQPAPRTADFAAWWERQQAREAATRAREAPGDRRRALTRDQFEFWNAQRERQGRVPRSPF